MVASTGSVKNLRTLSTRCHKPEVYRFCMTCAASTAEVPATCGTEAACTCCWCCAYTVMRATLCSNTWSAWASCASTTLSLGDSTWVVANGVIEVRLDGNSKLVLLFVPKSTEASCLERSSCLSCNAACCVCCLAVVKACSHFHTDWRKDTATPLRVTITSCSVRATSTSTYTGW